MKIGKKILKGFKKNDIVIYAIALMLVTAGYLNYTTNVEFLEQETYSEDIAKLSDNTQIDNNEQNTNEEEDINEEETNNSEENVDVESTSSEIANNEETKEETNNEDSENNENSNEDNEDDEDIGEAKLVSNNEVEEDNDDSNKDEESSDYFVNSKLERDKSFASMISTYTQIMEDDSISETQKSIAMTEITNINNTKNAIDICENILSTKGFSNLVIFVNNGSINIVVEVEGGLTTEKVAQIQNVVSREFDADISNIHITEKE